MPEATIYLDSTGFSFEWSDNGIGCVIEHVGKWIDLSDGKWHVSFDYVRLYA